MADKVKGDDKISEAAEKAMSNLKPEDIQKLLSNPSSMAGISQQLAAHINQAMGQQDQLSMLPLVVRKRIRALKNFQLATTEVEAEFYLEVQKLEAKYLALYQPIFDKRKDIVTGSREPTDEEAHWSDDGDDDEEEEEPAKKSEAGSSATNGASTEDDGPTTGIKDFWIIALKNCEIFADIIKEHDEPVLSHLTDMKVTYANDSGLDFALEFHFSDNEWFTNKVLTKSYTVTCKVDKEDPWAFEGASITDGKGCCIDWKKGKNLTVKTVKKKQKHKGKGQGQARTVTKTIPNETFFNIFSLPSLDQKDGASEDEDDLAQTLSNDYTRAEFIRDRLIPKAVLFYTGEALDEDGDDEDFDDDFDEEDDELEDDYNPQKDVADVKPPDCKQQ